MGICVEACSRHTDCSADELCCSTGCGHTCQSGNAKLTTRELCNFKFTWSEIKHLYWKLELISNNFSKLQVYYLTLGIVINDMVISYGESFSGVGQAQDQAKILCT